MTSLRDKLLRPIEKEMSRALALYHIISETQENLTEDEAKKILVDYLSLESDYNWVVRKLYGFTISKVNWQTVIKESLDPEVLSSVRIELLSHQIKRDV